MPAKRTRVLLVDDHPVVRHGIRQMLAQEPDMEVCCDAGSVAEALTTIESQGPDLAVVDVALGSEDGLELVKQIAARWPEVFVLVLSMHSEKLYAERAIRAGAHGYLMKDEPPEQLVAAIRKVRDGGVYVSEKLQAEWLKRMASGKRAALTPLERLTDRELAVFRLIGTGLGTRQIAEQLNLSVKTVESYRESIKDKLDIPTGTELIRQATLWVHDTPAD
jgi:DNA-binding NarL/FixJ family response regulator